MKALDYSRKEKEDLIDFFASQMKLTITKELNEAIDELEAFENRVCENCKHCSFMSKVNSYFCINEFCTAKFVDSCFGCNRWESKNERD